MTAKVLEALGVERNNRWTFRQADGTLLERWTGSVLIHVAGRRAADEVVFVSPGIWSCSDRGAWRGSIPGSSP